MFCASSRLTSKGSRTPVVLDALAVDHGPAARKLPVGAGREVLERLDPVLGQRLEHLGRQPLEVEQAVLGAQFPRRSSSALRFCSSMKSLARA